MSRLEDLTVGSSVSGLVNNQSVQIVAVKWYGSSVLEITYKNSQGMLANQLVYREDEARLQVEEDNLPWSFDADGDTMRLASEAYRINLSHLFDPYLAVHTSSIEPLPHQISAVYQEMLPRLPLRYILADDPGAGKTIMTGLLLKELIIRGDLKRCLMKAVMDIERKLGFIPNDVSGKKCGYDVESEIPKEMRTGDGACLRFIEVKGRAKGATTVTISKNEILTGLNRPEEFILAIVEVDGDHTRTVYLKEPFAGMDKPSFAEVNRSFNIEDLIRNAEIIYQE